MIFILINKELESNGRKSNSTKKNKNDVDTNLKNEFQEKKQNKNSLIA